MGEIFGRLAELESENPILWTVEIKKVPEIQEGENMGKTAISGRNDSSAYLDWLVPAAVTTSSHSVVPTDRNSIVSWSHACPGLSQVVSGKRTCPSGF